MKRKQPEYMNLQSAHGSIAGCLACLVLVWGTWTHALAQSDETKSDPDTSNPIETTATDQSEAASEDKAGPTNEFESFSLILDRNIFDPDRRGPREQRRERPPEPPREESFTLLGTMFYSDKQLAFFDGTDSDWAGAVKLGESVAGHKLTNIDFDKVEIDWNGETIVLEVGFARTKRGEEPWSTKGRDEWSGNSRRSSRRSSSGSGSSGSSAESTPALDGDASDILKQMMERRKQSQGQ